MVQTAPDKTSQLITKKKKKKNKTEGMPAKLFYDKKSGKEVSRKLLDISFRNTDAKY